MAKNSKLIRPGPPGRAIRILAGLVTLSLTYELLTTLRSMWAGDLPISSISFWFAMAVTFGLTSWVVTAALATEWGRKPLLVGLAGGAIASIVGLAVDGNLFGAVFTTYLWAWALAVTTVLGVTFLIAGAVGQPGCEMRVYASLLARRKGGKGVAMACKGGIDRWDHIGSPDTK